jgi:hypothetical protein
MTKEEKLKKLDDSVLDKMLLFIEQEKYELIASLSVPIQYLKANQVVEKEKPTDDAVSQRKKKLAEVKARRE